MSKTLQGTQMFENRKTRRLPGEEGVWLFVFGDMLIFALLFGLFLSYRAASLEIYEESQPLLSINLGTVNTIILLTSSWLVAMAVEAAKSDKYKRAQKLIGLSLLCGFGFILVKVFEYGGKLSHGITGGTNEFFMYYYVLTGLHLVHVVVGLIVLAYLRARLGAEIKSETETQILESGATYWHMVDFLWIIIFQLLYVL